ncbi:1-acyl-sn-glycerol-3-phosphate acyltransferase [candidate division WOR-3 bacterium]|nr:1-acyl-sn-glycerol-3-phosphate acyltransferase [candidate division WOR-3 bacterium]
MELYDSNTEKEWWNFEPPPSAYDLVGNNLLTRFLRPLFYILIRFYFHIYHKLRIRGYKKYYSKNPYIIVANHSSHLDTPLILSCFSLDSVNKIRAIAALDYFFSNPLVRISTHLLCNIIPINRKTADLTSIGMISKSLKEGGSIIIFPEGTRSRDGEINKFKPGVGLLIKKTKAEVLPIFIKGTYNCMNRGTKLPRRGPLEIQFGSPLKYDRFFKDEQNYDKIVDKLYREILRVSKL